MGRMSRNYKADLKELADEYQGTRDEIFNNEFVKFFAELIIEGNITEDDIQGFMDSFEFQSEDEWCASEYQSRLDSFNDAKHEEMKERRMGL